jgi:hypothetical protein
VQQGLGSPDEVEQIELLSYLNLAHEFAHSFGVKDEYAYVSNTGAISSGQYMEVDGGRPEEAKFIKRRKNCQHLFHLRDGRRSGASESARHLHLPTCAP